MFEVLGWAYPPRAKGRGKFKKGKRQKGFKKNYFLFLKN
jgi:hypothetical protein